MRDDRIRRMATKAHVMARVTRARWPFTSRAENVKGLYAQTGSWARARGVFRVVLDLDTNLFVTAPSLLAELVLYHEATHAAERHGAQAFFFRLLMLGGAAESWTLSPAATVTIFLCAFPASLGLRAYQEARADACAAQTMDAGRFARALLLSWSKPRRRGGPSTPAP